MLPGPVLLPPALHITDARQSRLHEPLAPAGSATQPGGVRTPQFTRGFLPQSSLALGVGRASAVVGGRPGPREGKGPVHRPQRSRELGPQKEPDLERPCPTHCPRPRPLVCRWGDLGHPGLHICKCSSFSHPHSRWGAYSNPILLAQETPGYHPRCSCPQRTTLAMGCGPDEEGNTSTPGRKRKR